MRNYLLWNWYQRASIPVIAYWVHPSEPVSFDIHEIIRLVNNDANSELLQLMHIHCEILVNAIIQTHWTTIEVVKSTNRLTCVLVLSNLIKIKRYFLMRIWIIQHKTDNVSFLLRKLACLIFQRTTNNYHVMMLLFWKNQFIVWFH